MDVRTIRAVVTIAAWLLPTFLCAEQPVVRGFGFAGGCDTDAYVQETAPFTNLCTIELDDDRLLDARWISRMVVRDVELIVSVQNVFFEAVGQPGDLGQPHDLRADSQQRWRSAISGREEALRTLAALIFVADEPYWNGISRSELATANHLVTSTLPFATTVTSFSPQIAGEWFEGRDVPTGAVAYHHYAVLDPLTDGRYQSNVNMIKAHAHGRPLYYVLDAWWTPSHGEAGIRPEDMADVARNYFRMASADADAIGLVAFRWSSSAAGIGARDLPFIARQTHRDIGSEITGKCAVPNFVEPRTALFLVGCRYVATMAVRTDDGVRLASAMPREADYGTFVLDEGEVIGGVRVIEGEPPTVFASLYTNTPAHIRVYETATGAIVWPVDSASIPNR